ncbi:hypothetical protein CPB86DRAFT_746755 [Serendipita vermifera]|nr:hypothetical protein CPB86DRAFT_746755 [Serendipita vermifera]
MFWSSDNSAKAASSGGSWLDWLLPTSLAGGLGKKLGLVGTEDEPRTKLLQHTSLFALIIGIDDYKSSKWPNLRGGIADARAMQEYLEEKLAIPKPHIRTLHGEQATRDAIISELRGLKTNPLISPGDSIVIFYAGHGDAGTVPDGWDDPTNEIQLLVPYDGDTEEKGVFTYSIPDRTICALLEDIAKEKGDNITVIFDCCHSTSLTRGEADENIVVRGQKTGVGIPATLDRDIWGGKRGATVAAGFEKTGLSSHVALSACGAKEVAEEDSGRGLFTRTLLKTFGEIGDSQITYSELIRKISLPRQNAQCEGRHQNRICFSSDVLSRFVSYPVKKSDEGYIMEAGEANGVTTGAVFAVYKERGSILSSDPIALFETHKPDKFSTKLNLASKLKGDINEGAVAVQVKAGMEESLRIHCDKSLKKLSKAVSQKAAEDKKKAYNFELVETPENASLGISLESKEVAFHILDEAATKHGVNRMPFRVPANVDDLHRVLVAAAHYYWHYSREPAKSQKEKSPPVNIEFLELKPASGGERLLEPCSSNLIKDKTIEITGDEDKFYGIKITNTREFPLFVSVFYFDHSSLEILSYYQPPTGHGKVDPSIEPKGSLSIGYGSSGAEPYGYVVSGDADKEVGFLKVFISSEKVDLSGIPQASPFSEDERRPGNTRGARQRPKEPQSFWYSETIPIVIRE